MLLIKHYTIMILSVIIIFLIVFLYLLTLSVYNLPVVHSDEFKNFFIILLIIILLECSIFTILYLIKIYLGYKTTLFCFIKNLTYNSLIIFLLILYSYIFKILSILIICVYLDISNETFLYEKVDFYIISFTRRFSESEKLDFLNQNLIQKEKKINFFENYKLFLRLKII